MLSGLSQSLGTVFGCSAALGAGQRETRLTDRFPLTASAPPCDQVEPWGLGLGLRGPLQAFPLLVTCDFFPANCFLRGGHGTYEKG